MFRFKKCEQVLLKALGFVLILESESISLLFIM